MLTEHLLHMKREMLNLLDSSIVGFAYIIAAISIDQLSWTYKALMVILGLILSIKGWFNMKEAKLKKENSEYELKIKKLKYEKIIEDDKI